MPRQADALPWHIEDALTALVKKAKKRKAKKSVSGASVRAARATGNPKRTGCTRRTR